MLIDTHLHLIDRGRLHYQWLGTAPALDRDFLLSDYGAEASALGIQAAIFMEVDVDPGQMEREIDYVETLPLDTSAPPIIGAIAACRPEETGFEAYLERIQARPFVKGLRRLIQSLPDAVFADTLFRANIARLASASLTFDICARADQIAGTLSLIDSAPGVQFVLDHCGGPDIRTGSFSPWQAGISEIARRPNVICKISGIPAYAPENWTAETLKPYVHHVIERFGWDRVVWGSDWPVCTQGGGLTRWVTATRLLVADADAADRARLFHLNAQKLWALS